MDTPANINRLIATCWQILFSGVLWVMLLTFVFQGFLLSMHNVLPAVKYACVEICNLRGRILCCLKPFSCSQNRDCISQHAKCASLFFFLLFFNHFDFPVFPETLIFAGKEKLRVGSSGEVRIPNQRSYLAGVRWIFVKSWKHFECCVRLTHPKVEQCECLQI